MDGSVPTIAELAVAVEGLALLRSLYGPSAEVRSARLVESRQILDQLGEPPYDQEVGRELDVGAGYRHWSRTYDRPLRLFSLEEPPMLRLIEAVPRVTRSTWAAVRAAGRPTSTASGTGCRASTSPRRCWSWRGPSCPTARSARAISPISPSTTARPTSSSAPSAWCTSRTWPGRSPRSPGCSDPGGRAVVSDVHPMLVALGWQAQFPTDDGRAFMRLHQHLASDYVRAAARGRPLARHLRGADAHRGGGDHADLGADPRRHPARLPRPARCGRVGAPPGVTPCSAGPGRHDLGCRCLPDEGDGST